MLKGQDIPLKIYWVAISSITLNDIYHFSTKKDNAYIYLQIIQSFDHHFAYLFLLTVIKFVLTTLHIIPVFCYIYRRALLTQKFWQTAFILKIIFDIYGNPYEILHLKALAHSNTLLLSYLTIGFLALYGPWYVICFRYAFKNLGIFTKK